MNYKPEETRRAKPRCHHQWKLLFIHFPHFLIIKTILATMLWFESYVLQAEQWQSSNNFKQQAHATLCLNSPLTRTSNVKTPPNKHLKGKQHNFACSTNSGFSPAELQSGCISLWTQVDQAFSSLFKGCVICVRVWGPNRWWVTVQMETYIYLLVILT